MHSGLSCDAYFESSPGKVSQSAFHSFGTSDSARAPYPYARTTCSATEPWSSPLPGPVAGAYLNARLVLSATGEPQLIPNVPGAH